MSKYEKIFRGRPVEDLDFEEILYDKNDWVATITLNRLNNIDLGARTAGQT